MDGALGVGNHREVGELHLRAGGDVARRFDPFCNGPVDGAHAVEVVQHQLDVSQGLLGGAAVLAEPSEVHRHDDALPDLPGFVRFPAVVVVDVAGELAVGVLLRAGVEHLDGLVLC